jgi:hypothetical protein
MHPGMGQATSLNCVHRAALQSSVQLHRVKRLTPENRCQADSSAAWTDYRSKCSLLLSETFTFQATTLLRGLLNQMSTNYEYKTRRQGVEPI